MSESASLTDVNAAQPGEQILVPGRRSAAVRQRGGTLGRGIFGLIDQGAASLGNFITFLLLGHYLEPAAFGKFTILFDILIVLNSLTAAVIIYPLTIRGARGGRGRMRRFATASLLLTGVVLVPLGAMLAVAVLLMHGDLITAIWAALALMAWQLQETSRRALTATLRFRDVIWGDLISYCGQAAFVALLASRLTLCDVFIVMTITSFAACVLQLWQVRLRPIQLRAVWKMARDFWRPGRWMLMSNLTSIISIQAVTWVLAAFGGFAVVGAYQSMATLLRVVNPVITGIGAVMTPATVQAQRSAGERAAWRVSLRYAGLGGLLLAPYMLVLVIWPARCLALVYGHASTYVASANLLRIYVLAVAIVYVAQMLLTYLAAVEKTRTAFFVQGVTTIVAICVSLPLTARYGLQGVVYGVLITAVVRAVAVLVSLRSTRGERSGPLPAPAESQSSYGTLIRTS